MEEYTRKVLEMHDNDPNDTKTISAMTVMTRRLNKSLKCSNHTIQTQMHNFGKGSGADRVTQSCLTIKPNTPGIAARMTPGSGPAPQGRKPKDRSGEFLAAPSTSGQPVILAKADNLPKVTRKRPHDFTYGKNQAGREKAKQLGILPFTYWVFLTTYNFLAWLGITICVKKLEASNNMSFDS